MLKKLSVERMFELETWLANNVPKEYDSDKALIFCAQQFCGEELDYLMKAFRMPFHEVSVAINVYDSSCPKMDELAFVASLESNFCQSHTDVIRRIRHVRKVMQFISRNKIRSFSMIGDLPCDDGWYTLIKNDKECSSRLECALSFEGRRKALVERYLLLQEMIEYNGLSVEEIKKEANKESENVLKLKKIRKDGENLQ